MAADDNMIMLVLVTECPRPISYLALGSLERKSLVPDDHRIGFVLSSSDNTMALFLVLVLVV